MYENRKKRLIDWINSIENPDILNEIEAIAITNSPNKKIRVKTNEGLKLSFGLHPENIQPKENCCSNSEIEYLKKYFTYLHKKKK